MTFPVVTQKQQPQPDVKVNSVRPELLIFRNYHCKRTSPKVVAVWLEGHCAVCKTSLALNSSFIRATMEDEVIRQHGLKFFKGDKPPLGYKIHSEGPLLCEAHREEWLAGKDQAVDVEISQVKTRSYS